jgi:hypothetical protein
LRKLGALEGHIACSNAGRKGDTHMNDFTTIPANAL